MRAPKKILNLNKLKTGCSPCFNEVKKIERKIKNRKLSKIKIQEIKNIVSSIFEENKKF
tara:strand:- start:284 stop:460 length:177 start_codon:yes stop_codon:yes gene_type:complete